MKRYTWEEKPEAIPEEKIQHTEGADVVIIGAGHAGTTAARAAAEEGASVIVIEQQEEEKQWILGMGEIGHINSRWQKEHGVPDVDLDEFLDDWQLRTGNRSNYRLIRKYAENCGNAFDWFIEPLTEEEKNQIHPMMTPPSPHFPKSLNGMKAWPGSANMGVELQDKAVKGCQRIAKEHGAKFFFGARAEQLVRTDGREDDSGNGVKTSNRKSDREKDNFYTEHENDGPESSRVSGVIARMPDGSYTRFLAHKGVVLAAGDYSKNAEMCHDLLAEADDLIDEGDMTGHGWDGSGIRMGIWAGGRLEPRSHAAMGGNYSFPGFDLIGSTATLRVNCHGRRYSNEGFGTHILAAFPGAKQPNGMNWGIFDSDIFNEVTYQAPNHAEFDYTDPKEVEKLQKALVKARERKGQKLDVTDKAGSTRPLYCADTIEELAGLLFDGTREQENFIAAVTRYNELCASGKDIDFGKDPNLLHPIRKAPFYACGNRKDSHHPGGQSLKLLVTVSGLLIDENQQVLGMDFEPIDGLYATGNCSGCRFGAQYTTSLPGQSISIAQTLGRELGRYLAKI